MPAPLLFIIMAVLGIAFLVLIAVFIKDNNRSIQKQNHDQAIQKMEKRGIEAESDILFSLDEIIGNDGYILNNLLIPTSNNNMTEIDAIIISKKGIFCVEIKGWSGIVYGNDFDQTWTKRSYNGDIKELTNPVKQNEKHTEIVGMVLDFVYDVKNIVMFDNRAELYVTSNFTHTISTFRRYYQSLPEIYNDFDVRNIKNNLFRYKPSEEEYQMFVTEMKEKYQDR